MRIMTILWTILKRRKDVDGLVRRRLPSHGRRSKMGKN
jgi:hypothetical protein